jgi:deoxyadenosine/deoxycytidine kinase
MNKRYLINIRGTNGSGKSTLVNAILHLTPDVSVKSFTKNISYFRKNGDFIESKDVKLSYAVSNDLNLAVVGRYQDGKSKGCDGQKSFTETQRIIEQIIKKRPDHHILFEGVLIATCFESWKNFFDEVKTKYPYVEPVVVFLQTDWKECIKRVTNRGGKKPEDLVVDAKGKTKIQSKHESIERVLPKMLDAGIRCIELNTKNKTVDELVCDLFQLLFDK